ncbi:MAG: VWA domain-containing protein, partial [Planctomycetota bacterium]
MKALLLDPSGKSRRWPLFSLAAGWLVSVFALAGPTWEQIPSPVFHGSHATVFVVNLSDSMSAADVAPSRMGRARFELQDALHKISGEKMGLVIFSDEPYVVTPLAEDPRVIEQSIPVLSPDLMPGKGDRVDRAIDQAHDLLVQAGAASGRILLLTDSVGEDSKASLVAAQRAKEDGYEVSVLSFGTEEGAPIPQRGKRGFQLDSSGKPVLAHLNVKALQGLAAAGGGKYSPSTANDSDLEKVLPILSEEAWQLTASEEYASGFDTWNDFGAWCVLLPLGLALLAFRKKQENFAALMALAIMPNLQEPVQQHELFQRPDQVAASAFQHKDFEQAAQTFQRQDWKASALYKAGRFEEAAEAFSEIEGEDAIYNRGNALAKAGKLEEAVKAYDEALKLNPKHVDAQFNRDLVQDLLDKQDK